MEAPAPKAKAAAAPKAAGASVDPGPALYSIAEGDLFHYEPWDSVTAADPGPPVFAIAKWIDGELVVHCDEEPLSSGIRSFKTMPGEAVALLRGKEVKLIWSKNGQVRAKMTSDDEIKVYHPTGEYVFYRHFPEGSRPVDPTKDPVLLKKIADQGAIIVELTHDLEIERQSVASLSAENANNIEALSVLRDSAVQDRLRLASLEDELRMMEAERVQVALGQCSNQTEGIASFVGQNKSAIWLVVSSPTIGQDGSDVMHGLQSLAGEFSNVAIACDWPGSPNTRNVDSSIWDGIKPHADAFTASGFHDNASFKALRGALYNSLWFKMYGGMVKGHIRAAVVARPDLNVKCVLIEGGAISRCEAHAMTFLVEEVRQELADSGFFPTGLAVVRCGSFHELRAQLQGTAQLADEAFDPGTFATVRAELHEVEEYHSHSSCAEELLARSAAARDEGERPTRELRALREHLRREMGRSADLEKLVHGHLATLNAELPRGEGGQLEIMTQSTPQEHAPLDLPRIFWDWQRQVSSVRLFVLEHHRTMIKDKALGSKGVEGRLDRAHKLLQKQQASLQQLEGELLSLVKGPARQQSELPPVSPANPARSPSALSSKSNMSRTVSLPALRSPKGGGAAQAQH